jgi:hypothetical protein
MGTKDKRIDVYIANAESFAQPVLRHIRKIVHHACPDIQETIKWSFPIFDYHGILCYMAAFKKHCAFGFWKISLLPDPENRLSKKGETAMGNFGRLTTVRDLPLDAILIKYIKEAAKLNKERVKVIKKPRSSLKKALIHPDYFTKAPAKNKKALKTFKGFNYSNKKEYVEWITGAKTEETRNSRMTTAIE